MNAIVPFRFDNQPVRVVELDGQPWFVLADACAVLGLKNPTMAAKPLDETERAKFNLGRDGEATIVSLPGLLTLMLRCRGAMKPDTVPYRLRKFITAEVMPSVLNTGGYSAPGAMALPRDPRQLLAYLAQQAGDMVGLQDAVAVLSPKAEALDRFAASDGALTPTAAAKTLGVRPGRLFDWLEANRWLYRGADGLLGHATKLDQGLIEHKPLTLDRNRQKPKVVTQALITAKGLARLAELRAGL